MPDSPFQRFKKKVIRESQLAALEKKRKLSQIDVEDVVDDDTTSVKKVKLPSDDGNETDSLPEEDEKTLRRAESISPEDLTLAASSHWLDQFELLNKDG